MRTDNAPQKTLRDSSGKMRSHTEAVCDTCKSFFWKPTRFLNRRSADFCSKDCSYEDRKSKISVLCGFCGEEFKVKSHRYDRSKSGVLFCNKKCQDLYQRIDSGFSPLNPYYKNGDSVYQERAYRHYGKYCRDCGETREFLLCVHHIDGDRRNNSIENLEVLCFNHHAVRHLGEDGKYNNSFLTPRELIQKYNTGD